eukprot:SAG31_NODE_1137_length_9727_cov_40.714894_2_plen_93_part_00
MEKGLSAFEMKLQSLIEQRPMLKEASTASRAGTTFVGIEMIAQVLYNPQIVLSLHHCVLDLQTNLRARCVYNTLHLVGCIYGRSNFFLIAGC